ncbi:hypothetical protein CRYUN_Cryun11dG0114600 [Craigia yunnanensis]
MGTINIDCLEKLKAFFVLTFLPMCAKFGLRRSQPQPQPQPPPTLSLSQTSSIADLESHLLPTLPSPPPSANGPETLQPASLPSAINLESSRQPTQPSAPPPSTNDLGTRQPQSTPSPTPTTSSNLKQLESILAVQQHLQLKNSVLSFCFSYALAVSLQYAQTDHQANHPDSSFLLLSFLVLLTFNLILVALFISPSYTKTSEVLEKVAFLVAAAAFCHAIAIPFPFELKCAVLAVFLHSLLLITIFEYLNRNIV